MNFKNQFFYADCTRFEWRQDGVMVGSLRTVDFDIQRGYAWGGKPHTVRFSSPNPTFSACCGCWETFKPLGLRGRDSAITWLRQYQYNLHSPLQPGVVKALLLVLRSSAALALAAVAPLCVAQFIRMRTARSAHGGARNRSANQPPADCKP